MAHQFHKHYTREEARQLLPLVRQWLKGLLQLRTGVQQYDQQLSQLMQPGCDVGGDVVNCWVRALAELKALLLEFYQREIQIKDLDRGLIDFPALMDGKEIFLCWEQSEEDIEFWHALDAGYAGRERIE